jgi:hypothetical protein
MAKKYSQANRKDTIAPQQATQVAYLVDLIEKEVTRAECCKLFNKKYDLASVERFNRLYPKAVKVIAAKVLEATEASNQAYVATKAQQAVSEVLSKQEALEILSKIAKGIVTKYGEVVMIPTQADKTKAIAEMAKLQDWIPKTKIDVTTNGKELPATPTVTKVILKI